MTDASPPGQPPSGPSDDLPPDDHPPADGGTQPRDSDGEGDIVDTLLFRCLDRPEGEWWDALEKVCTEHPEHAEALRRRFDTLARVGMAGMGLDHDAEERSLRATSRAGAEGAIAPPVEMPDYALDQFMGGGSMGVVFGGVQRSSGRAVAIKFLHSYLLGSPGARQRFERETELAARVQHPNLCAVLEAGIRGSVPFLVMERVDGDDLRDWIRRQDWGGEDRARTQRVLTWGAQVADALDAAHRAGLIHRDVKPGNVLIDGMREGVLRASESRAVLVDFGLAREQGGDRLTATGEIVGSPAYMSPEAIAGAAGDAQHDIYALGATVYEALTGRLPYQAPTREAMFRAILTQPPPPVGAGVGPRAGDIDLVLATAMAKDAGRRYQTAAAFAADLRSLVAAQPVSVRRPPWPGRAREWLVRNRVAAGVGAVLLLGAAVLLYVLRETQRERDQERARTAAYRALDRGGPLAVQGAEAAFRAAPDVHTRSALVQATAGYHDARSWSGVFEPRARLHRVALGSDGWAARARLDGVDVDHFEGDATRSLLTGDHSRTAARAGMLRVAIVDGGFGLTIADDASGSGAAPTVLPDDGRQIHAVATDGTLIATGEADAHVRLWNRRGKLMAELVGHRSPVCCLGFGPGGQLISGAEDGEVRVWSVRGWGMLDAFDRHVVGLAAVPEERGVVAVDAAGRGVVYELGESGVVAARRELDLRGDVDSFAVGDDGDVAVRRGDGSVWLWPGLSTAAASRDPRFLVVEGRGPAGMEPAGKGLSVGLPTPGTLALSGSVLLAVSQGSLMRWLKQPNGQWAARADDARFGLPAGFRAVALSAAGDSVAVGTDRGSVHLFDFAGGAVWDEREAHKDRVQALALSAADNRVATASRDSTAALWPGGMRLDHEEAVSCAAWGADGRLATGSVGGAVCVWGSDGELSVSVRGPRAAVRHLCFSGDDLWSASTDRVVRRWRVRDEALLELAEEQRAAGKGVGRGR